MAWSCILVCLYYYTPALSAVAWCPSFHNPLSLILSKSIVSVKSKNRLSIELELMSRSIIFSKYSNHCDQWSRYLNVSDGGTNRRTESDSLRQSQHCGILVQPRFAWHRAVKYGTYEYGTNKIYLLVFNVFVLAAAILFFIASTLDDCLWFCWISFGICYCCNYNKCWRLVTYAVMQKVH